MLSFLNVLFRLIFIILGCRYCFYFCFLDEELRFIDCDLFMIIVYNGRVGFEFRFDFRFFVDFIILYCFLEVFINL